MNRTRHNGLTLVELVIMIALVIVVALALIPLIREAMLSAEVVRMKERSGRGIWIAIVSANACREPLGKLPFWPCETGYGETNTSTAYFRYLMSDGSGNVTGNLQDQLVSDLTPLLLGGSGVPVAETASAFSSANNAWSVLCVTNDTPAEVAFLVTRNADLEQPVSSNAVVSLCDEKPFGRKRVVWVTHGGGCFDTKPRAFTGATLVPTTNLLEVMRP